MLKARQEIKNIKDRYITELKKMGISVERVVLFGSYAKGYAREDSDIDFLIVSADFYGKNLRERLEILGLAAGRVFEPIEAMGYTEEEIEHIKTEDSFVGQILVGGVSV